MRKNHYPEMPNNTKRHSSSGTQHEVAKILKHLRSFASPANTAGMARFGIVSEREIIGVPSAAMRSLARQYCRNHDLAHALWATGVYAARILAAVIDDPAAV